MAPLVRLLAFFTIVIGGPVAAGFLVAPGSWADERFDVMDVDEAYGPDRPQRVALSMTPIVEPETGWWHVPSEPGLGLILERNGARVMVGAMAYESDGRAAWSLSSGILGCDSSFESTLVAYSGGQTLSGRHRKAAIAREIGKIAIQFSSPSEAMLTLPDGRSLPMQRYRLGGGVPSSFSPEPGWWWNPAEPGRGFAIEVRHGAVLLSGAVYDDAGNPTWYVSYGMLNDDRGYRGRWYRLSGGVTLDGGGKATPDTTDVGPVALKFVDDAGVLLTLPDGRSVSLGRFDPAAARGLLALTPVADEAPKDCTPTVRLAQAG